MSGTTDAVLKFPVAVSCFAAQRMLGVLPLVGDWEPVRAAQKSLYERGEEAKKSFSDNTMLFGAFQFGDKAQSALASLAEDTMSLKVLKPSYMMDFVSDVFKGSTDAVDAVSTGDARSLLQDQFKNTGDVIGFVNNNDAPRTLADDGSYPLEAEVERCYARGDYPALWLVEGLGERYAEAFLDAGWETRGLLTNEPVTALPAKIQLMMHAGAGIAFAKHEVGPLNPWSTETEIRAALERFLDLVRESSVPGYEGAAIESLGLVTRTWYPQLVSLISDNLLAVDVNAREYFWHGAGRAMYFSPMNMLPGLSPWDAADKEPSDEIARLNARAGVAWAFTIVNVRHPGIASHFLRYKADRIKENDAYTNGVHSTLIMAGDMVPGHRYVAEFCAHKPDAADSAAVDEWTKHIGSNIQAQIDQYRETLRTHGKLGEVFRFHALPDFIADLGL